MKKFLKQALARAEADAHEAFKNPRPGDVRWVARWHPWDAYVRDLRSMSRPYTNDPQQAKQWKSRAAAERWVGIRPLFTIEEITID